MKKALYTAVIAFCFLPFVSPALALCIGIFFSLLGLTHDRLHAYTSKVLQLSVVLLGFGMNLGDVVSASKSGFIETSISVSAVMLCGLLLGKLFRVEKNTSILIATGTAICGGSAIAAVAPILNSKSYQSSFALIVVFVLNAIALLVFPFVGHRLGLSQEVFGNWAAIAIHDTSSVVGAGAIYGEEALQVATTVKLIRALWIIPLSLVIAFFSPGGWRKAGGTEKSLDGADKSFSGTDNQLDGAKSQQEGAGKRSIKFPWFILFFALAIVFAAVFPAFESSYAHFSWLGRRGMVVALFLIGSNITVSQIKQSGFKSFALGITLWAVTAVGSLLLLTRF